MATDLILFPNRVLPFPNMKGGGGRKRGREAQLARLNLIRVRGLRYWKSELCGDYPGRRVKEIG